MSEWIYTSDRNPDANVVVWAKSNEFGEPRLAKITETGNWYAGYNGHAPSFRCAVTPLAWHPLIPPEHP